MEPSAAALGRSTRRQRGGGGPLPAADRRVGVPARGYLLGVPRKDGVTSTRAALDRARGGDPL